MGALLKAEVIAAQLAIDQEAGGGDSKSSGPKVPAPPSIVLATKYLDKAHTEAARLKALPAEELDQAQIVQAEMLLRKLAEIEARLNAGWHPHYQVQR